MKKILLPLALVLIAGVAVAQAADTKSASKAATKTSASVKAPAHKSHIVDAEVVSADAPGKTITVKVAGEEKTVPVQGKATAHLAMLKAGEKVALTCVDNEKGEHQYVSAIKVEPAKAKAAKKTSSK
jgi:ABC-type Fe3+-hydroxamate transport system substrate-binding protein